MAPTILYYPHLKNLVKNGLISGISHITGGGLVGNVPRMLPQNLSASIKKDTFYTNEIFKWFQNIASISDEEMFKTFNCGLGIVLCVNKNNYKKFVNLISDGDLPIFEIGKIHNTQTNVRCTIL